MPSDFGSTARGKGSPRKKVAPRAPRKPSGVFARPLEAPVQKLRREERGARRRAQRAQEKAPGQTLPVRRQVVPPRLSGRQRAALVEQQERRLRGRSPQERAQAARTGDRETRRALNQARGAQEAAQRENDVRVALDAVGAPRGARPRTPGARRDLQRLGRQITRERAIEARPGRPKARVAGLPVEQLGKDALRHVKRGQGTAAVRFFSKDAPRFVGRAGKDALLLPYNAVKGTYELGAAASESAQKLGAPKVLPGKASHERSKRLIKGATEGFVGESVQAGVAAARGDSKGARRHAGRAAKAFGEHPLYSGLEVSGVYGAAGRTAGAAARRGALGRKARELAQTRREPLRVSGTNVVVERSYSKNLFTASAQKARDKRRYEEARREGKSPAQARAAVNEARPSRVRDIAAAVTGNAVTPGREGLIRRSVDEQFAQSEARQRAGKQETASVVRDVGVRGSRRERARRLVTPGERRRAQVSPERTLVQLAASKEVGKAETVAADLWRIKQRLDDVYENEYGRVAVRNSDALRANRATVAAIDAYLRDRTPERDRRLVESGRKLREVARGNTRALRDLAALDDDQALAAAVRPAAVSRYGATFDPTKVDAPEQARVYARRKEEESAARSAVRAAKVERGRAARGSERARRKAAKELGRTELLVERAGRVDARQVQRLERTVATHKRAVANWRRRVREAQSSEAKARARESFAAAAKRRDAARERLDAVRAGQGTRPRAALARQERVEANVQVASRRVADAAGKVWPARQDLAAARRARRAAKPVKVERGLVLPDGSKLSTEAAVARLADEGLLSDATMSAVAAWRAVGEPGRDAPESAALRRAAVDDPELPGFVSQRRRAQGSAMSQTGRGRKRVDVKRRTGESTRIGAVEQTLDAAEEALVQQRMVVDMIRSHDEFMRQNGQLREDGRAFTVEEADAEIQARLNAGETYSRNGEEVPRWVARRATPSTYGRGQIDEILSQQGSSRIDPVRMLDDRVAASKDLVSDPGKRNVVLVDRIAEERWEEHRAVAEKRSVQAMQKLTAAFRGTVLSLSTKWLFGNGAEAAMRSLLEGVTPVDWWRGTRVTGGRPFGKTVVGELVKMDEKAAREFDIRTTGGLLYGMAERRQFGDRSSVEGTNFDSIGRAAGRGVNRQPLKAVLGGIDAYQAAVFAVNRALERQFQRAVIGKQLRREVSEVTGSWTRSLRLSGPAFEDAVRGLTGTARQERFAREMDRTLGKYSRLSPRTRAVVQTVAPFLPWYLNAMRFVYHTMPVGHPVKTAVLASVERTLEKDFEEQRKALPPGTLGAAIQLKDGGLLDLARYSPFSVATNLPAEPLGFLTDPIYPQFSTLYANAQGRSFTGRDLDKEGKEKVKPEERVPIAVNSFLESVVPGMALARRLRERGETPYDDSTVLSPKTKPGSARAEPGTGAALNRVLNPLRPTYLKARAGAGPSLPVRVSPDQEEARLEIESAREELAAEQELARRELELLRREVGGR